MTMRDLEALRLALESRGYVLGHDGTRWRIRECGGAKRVIASAMSQSALLPIARRLLAAENSRQPITAAPTC